MSLIARIQDAQIAAFMEESEREQALHQRELILERRRIEVITNQLTTVASTLNETLESLTESVGTPRYYLLGDVIVMVQQFMMGGDKPDPSVPRLVTLAYCTFLMALDSEGRLVHRKIGTLQFLDYAGIAAVISQAPGYNFDASEVRKHIPQLSQ